MARTQYGPHPAGCSGFARFEQSPSVHLGVRDRAKVDDGKFDSISHDPQFAGATSTLQK
jgi:hypothetical protein